MPLRPLFILTFLAIAGVSLLGQQEFQSSLAPYNKYSFNSAYAGMTFSLDASLGIRNQYAGLEGSPSSQYLDIHLPVYAFGGAMGVSLKNDALGAYRVTGVAVSGSKIFDSNRGLLAFSVRGGISQISLRQDDLRTPEGDYKDGSLNHNDPLLSGLSPGVIPSIELGAYFFNRRYELGVSISQFIEPSVNLGSGRFRGNTNIDAFAEYQIRTENFLFMPSIFIKSDFLLTQSEIHLTVKHYGSIFGGLGLRGYNMNSIDAFIFTLGFKISDKTFITYAFDSGLSTLRNVNEGSHEIMINYNLGQLIGETKKAKVIYNPRNL